MPSLFTNSRIVAHLTSPVSVSVRNPSLGVAVDLAGGHDGPDPSDEDGVEEPLDDSDDDGGLLLVLVTAEETSDHGGGAGNDTDGEDKDDETHGGVELDGVDLFVMFTHDY